MIDSLRRCLHVSALALSVVLAGCGRASPPGGPPMPAANAVAVADPARVALYNKGVGLMGAFAFEDAERIFSELASKAPDDRSARLNLAIAVLNQSAEGTQERALSLLDDLIKQDANDIRARYCAGLAQLFLGHPDDALKHFEVAERADATDAYAAYYVGQCLEYAGRFEDALSAYRRAAELDSYLRSPHLGQQRVLARLGRESEAAKALDAYLALDGNPQSRLVEFKYTRMGAKGEVVLPFVPVPSPRFAATPPFFAMQPVTTLGGPVWRSDGDVPNLTVADIDGTGELDLFAANALADGSNAVLLATQDKPFEFTLAIGHPLAHVTDVRCALWGDIDNDGRIDVYLCRKGPNQLWKNGNDGWKLVAPGAPIDGGNHDTVDGAMADLDHDGDLDIFLVNADGPCELLSNNADGSFTPIGQSSGASGDGRPARQVVVADFDRDRDADLFIVHDKPPHELLLNDRLWRYRKDDTLAGLANADIDAAVAADRDADGKLELYTLCSEGTLAEWRRDAEGWAPGTTIAAAALPSAQGGGLAILDVDGSGVPAVVVRNAGGFAAYGEAGSLVEHIASPFPRVPARAWTPLTTGVRGPSIAALSTDGLGLLTPTASRGRFLTLTLSGRIDPSQAMRSNASGIGARLAVRTGGSWSVSDTFRSSSGPGQSLQPLAIGLGGHERADFIALEWSDGVLQTELALDGDARHAVTETQRQISSCPVIFAWDGREFRFVTDCLGVGGLGYLAGVVRDGDGRLSPQYAPPRPWEHVLLPESLTLAPRDGAIELRLAEPMEEALYLDAARLAVYDIPPGWSMTIDERMSLNEAQPTGSARTYRRSIAPCRATDELGRDVLPSLERADGIAAEAGELDPRFIGLLRAPRSITLEFAEPLDRYAGEPVLVAHGWIEYPYCQTVFAAMQAGVTMDAPDLWARGADGVWTKISGPWGYPAGMSREMSLPLTGLPKGTTGLRLSTNQEIYWDAFAVAWAEPCDDIVPTHLKLLGASANECGFQQRIPQPQKRALYDYAARLPFWATRHQPGFYTALGSCDGLLRETDDAAAIIGPGEEIRLRFAPPDPLREGWTRRYVLELDGWCKDMDIFTGQGETLGPLPMRGADSSPARDAMHRKFQTRWRDGY